MLIHKVRMIDVYPREVGQLKVQTSEVNSSTSPSDSETTRRPQPIPQPTPTDNATVERLRTELEREKTTSKHLQDIISARLDDMLRLANENRQFLSDENQNKLQTASTLNGEVNRLTREAEGINQRIDDMNSNLIDLRRNIQDRKDETTRLQAQLDELSAQKELVDSRALRKTAS